MRSILSLIGPITFPVGVLFRKSNTTGPEKVIDVCKKDPFKNIKIIDEKLSERNIA